MSDAANELSPEEVKALTSEKNDLIIKLLEMQKKFREFEHDGGVDMHDYYVPPAGHPLEGYINEYNELAGKVNKLAHKIKKSGHIH